LAVASKKVPLSKWRVDQMLDVGRRTPGHIRRPHLTPCKK
jgi:hypothetical protein